MKSAYWGRLLGIALLSFSLTAAAVSRVGGGSIGSRLTGFEADYPAVFSSSFQTEEGMLVLSAPPFFTGKDTVEQWLVLQEFDRQFPELATLDAAGLGQALRERGFSAVTLNRSCLRAWWKSNSQSQILVMVWGTGRGVVANGTTTPLVQEGLWQLLTTIRLRPGACGWN